MIYIFFSTKLTGPRSIFELPSGVLNCSCGPFCIDDYFFKTWFERTISTYRVALSFEECYEVFYFGDSLDIGWPI